MNMNLNFIFKTEQDHLISKVKTHYDMVLEKYFNFTNLMWSLSTIEKNYHKALSDLSDDFVNKFENNEMTKSSYIFIKKIIDIKMNHSLTLSNEINEIFEIDLKKFSSELSYGFSNIFKDIRYIKNKIVELKQDKNFSEERFKKNQKLYFDSKKLNNSTSQEEPRLLYLKSLEEIKKACEIFQQQQIKIKTSLSYYENKCLDYSREMIMKFFIHNISHLKNIEYDVSNVIEDFKTKQKPNLVCENINDLNLVDPVFFDITKKEIYKLQNVFLYNQVQDEMYNIYDLTKFANETLILSKLFDNELLTIQELLKIRALPKNEKNEEDVFFCIFLQNLIQNKQKKIPLIEENYIFIRDTVYNYIVKKLLDEENFNLLFGLIYNWQFIEIINKTTNYSFFTKQELKNEEFIFKEDFWLQFLFKIFSPLKNDNRSSKQNVGRLLAVNYRSCLEILQNVKTVDKIFKNILEMNLGYKLEEIKAFKLGTENENLIFFKEEDLFGVKLNNSNLLKLF